MLKLLVFVVGSLVAVAQGGFIQPGAPAQFLSAAPILKTAPLAKVAVAEDFDPNPQYSYGYDVQDTLTGDLKNHYETRNGDVVQGQYSLVEPDGNRRIVDYNVDPVNGFQAVVRNEPLGVRAAPVAAAAATPVAYAAPAIAKVAAPVAKISPAPLVYSKTVIH